MTEIVDECDWFVSVLTAVRATGLPSAWTAAGVLRELLPDIVWEATNQAAVHTWYSEFFGGPPVAPLRSTAEGVAACLWTREPSSVRFRGSGVPNCRRAV